MPSLIAPHRRPPVRVLSVDEAAFIDAAMSRFFPGAIDAPEGSRYVEQTLHRALHPDDGDACSESRGGSAALYRSTIREAQAYCLRVYDARFQSLCPREQDVVLVLLEEGCDQMQRLVEKLLDDATTAFLTRALRPFLASTPQVGPAMKARALAISRLPWTA